MELEFDMWISLVLALSELLVYNLTEGYTAHSMSIGAEICWNHRLIFKEVARVSFGWVSTHFVLPSWNRYQTNIRRATTIHKINHLIHPYAAIKSFPFNTLSLPIDLERAASLHSVRISINGCTHDHVLTIDLFCDRQLPLPTFLDDFQGLLLRFPGLWFKARWVSFRS